jgi:acetylglutamate kinase
MHPEFRDGIRITTTEEMEVVDMVLAGRVNTELVRLAQRHNVPALGLTGADGALLTGRLLVPEDPSAPETRTAQPYRVDPNILRVALAAGYLPIVATVGIGEDSHAVNINADDAAQAIAEALTEATLCYLSDTPGVLDEDDSVLREIVPDQIETLISSGVVRDGMAAKLRSCAAAVNVGVREVMIGQYRNRGDLRAVVQGESGTAIRAGDGTR